MQQRPRARTRAENPTRDAVARTFIASASRRSGLKSVSPELLTITSSERAKRCRTSGAGPGPAWLTSPSTTSIVSRRNSANPVAVLLRQRFEYRRFLDHALEALQRSRRAVVPHQQIDAADFRQIREQIRQPHFADESRRADQQNVFSAQRIRGRKAVASPLRRIEMHYRHVTFGAGAFAPAGSLRPALPGFSRIPDRASARSRDSRPFGLRP